MNQQGKVSQNQSNAPGSAVKWQEIALCWIIGIPTVLGILAGAIFLAFLAWVVIGKIWLFLIIFSIAMLLLFWVCHLSNYAEIGKKTLEGKK